MENEEEMQIKVPYKNLEHTLRCLKKQVIDSLPYIQKYIPSDIATPEELFHYLRDLTAYKKDPKGIELLQTVQTLIDNNYHGKSGKGDCDCFTILVLASCEYLGFSPQQVALVGKSKISPTHIYSLVYDPEKDKMCAMDLTNPYYCMERSYPYKQTLNFMILELADNFLSGKSARKAKKAARQAGKVARVQARVAKRTARSEAKSTRKILRQDRRTDRTQQKGERKFFKRAKKVAKKEKGLIRVKGKQDIIKARQQETLDRIQNRQREETFDPSFSPDSDQSFMPDEEMSPGSTYQASEADEYYDYEQMPEGEDSYEENPEEYEAEYEEESMNDLSLPFIPAAMALIKKVSGKVKGKVDQVKASRAGQAAQKGASKYNEIMALKSENKNLKENLIRESKNKYIYGGVGTGIGALVGVIIGRATK